MSAELRALAEKATPGPWYAPDSYGEVRANAGQDHFLVATTGTENYERDALYLAAVSPDAILALLDERDAAIRRASDLMRANGDVALLWAEANDQREGLLTAARAVLACGVGNLSGDKYRRRVEAFDALDDAIEEAALRSQESRKPQYTVVETLQSRDKPPSDLHLQESQKQPEAET